MPSSNLRKYLELALEVYDLEDRLAALAAHSLPIDVGEQSYPLETQQRTLNHEMAALFKVLSDEEQSWLKTFPKGSSVSRRPAR